jgi:cob(I)alamin adenosyltransferase
MGSDCQLLILDEACAADQLNLVDRELLKEAVLNRPKDREVVLTGMNPAGWMTEAADYCTEMHCCRHPYERGVMAREAIEM